jgi:hypothetical protein
MEPPHFQQRQPWELMLEEQLVDGKGASSML